MRRIFKAPISGRLHIVDTTDMHSRTVVGPLCMGTAFRVRNIARYDVTETLMPLRSSLEGKKLCEKCGKLEDYIAVINLSRQ